jgi:hypothetical protein
MASGDPTSSEFSLSEALRGAFWTFAIGAIAVYIFFLALGAFSFGDVWPISILVAVLAGLWFWHSARERRHRDEEARDPRLRSARARRGF